MGARFKTEGITLKKGDLIMALTSNQHVLDWVKEMEELMTPDKTIWIDGSEGQLRALREQAFATGELTELNQEELPGCVLHHTAKNDVARVEVTDSIYVVLNMDIMTRVGVKALRQLGDSNDFVRGQHARADIDPENRYIVQFPEDNAIWSINSGYGGNVLLGKKCFALRIASYQGYKEGWMAEHMLILGIEDPQGNVDYITAAFPSACGKTNLAMLIPPEVYAKQGYKVWTVGDDIAWMHIGDDGRLYAINPENGFFGVAPGTNEKSNPNALHTTMKGTIFTNVAHNLENNTVWWEGLDKNPPEDVQEWTGLAVDGKEYIANGGKLAHPNSRFTAPAANCPCLSKEFNNPNGVPVTAMVFGGRRAKTAPLVYQSFSWAHGVYVGSAMASETTAAAAGAVGVVRRDPMAMRPFFGYNVGDYFAHWLEMGKKLGDKAPKIFNVNWFRTDDEGHFIWPGFGDNMRVLMWILKRCKGEAEAVETAIGYEPKPEDIDITGLDGVTVDTIKGLLDVDKELWLEDVKGVEELYAQIGDHVPAELHAEAAALRERLSK